VGHKYIAGTPQILLLLLPPSLFAFQRKNTNSSRIIFTIKNSRTAGGLLQELPAKQQTGIGANPPVFSFFFFPPLSFYSWFLWFQRWWGLFLLLLLVVKIRSAVVVNARMLGTGTGRATV